MFNTLLIARIYAHAIFSVSVEQKNISEWESKLLLFSEISKNALMQSLFLRLLEPKKISDIFIIICEDYTKKQVNIFGRNFIKIMAENNRLPLLPMVLKEFNNFKSVYKRTIRIEVISAWELKHRQLAEIADVLTRRLFRTVDIKNIVQKNILGGVIIRIGDTIIDGSIRGRISRLSNILLKS